MVTGLSHVSIAVPDLEAAARQLHDKYGLSVGARMINAEQGVRLAYVELGSGKIELMEPSRPDSPIAKFLERNPKGGIHHFCLGVDDVEKAARAFAQNGVRVLGPASRSATWPASRSPSSIPAIFWAHWSSSKSRKGEERDEDQAHRADRGQLSHEEAGLHGGRRDQTGGQRARAHRSR
jgi:methylmalonyl-CoA/ethylmalonyl-CoA epimerase